VLVPTFSPSVTSYTAETTNGTNLITATAAKPGATIAIKVNGVGHVNGTAATWISGVNVVEITVTYGTTQMIYTVTVTKTAPG